MALTALREISKVPETAKAVELAAAKTRVSDIQGELAADFKPDLGKLHAKVETLPKTYKFKAIKAGENEDAGLNKILNRFGINESASKYDKAVLSDDGNTLVIVNQGTISLNQLFGGTNGLARFAYKVYGPMMKAFGAADKDMAARRYYELFNAPNIEEHGEPLKDLIQALKSGEYHTVTVFQRDPNTKKFSPNPLAVAVTDAYYHLIDDYVADLMQGKPQAEIDAMIKALKEKFAKYYTLDKVIPLTADPNIDFKDLIHQLIEGLYQAQGFDGFVAPSQIHDDNINVNSNDLNYREIDWHFLRQNGAWKIVGNPGLLDKIITDKAQRDAYIAKMNPTDYSPKITIIRPKDLASKPIDPEIAALQQRSIVSQGSEIRIDNPEDLKLIGMTIPVNTAFIQAA